MADPRFLALATDPNLVPGIYNGCDQWCHYCPATSRCLAFQTQPPKTAGGDLHDNLHHALFESLAHTLACYEAEGLTPPAELLALAGKGHERPAYVPVDDPLEQMGKRYAIMATLFLAARDEPLPPGPLPKRPGGPTPFEVFLYYHVPIATKIYRAVSNSLQAARTGSAADRWDSDVSAKVALIAIERSCDALHVMTLDGPDPRLEIMRKQLSRLRREVEARFPEARTLVRPGLDD
jgi:hypothetical protein